MALSDTLIGELKAAATEFKQSYKAPSQPAAGGEVAAPSAEGEQKKADAEPKPSVQASGGGEAASQAAQGEPEAAAAEAEQTKK
jgi:hypothetical protein